MKQIQDIRPGKKRVRQPEPTEPVFSAPDFYAEAPSLPVLEPEIPAENIRPTKKQPKAKIGWLFFVLIVISITFFCGFELVKVKAKISANINGLNSSFSVLTDAMSKKDFAVLGGQVKTLNQKTNDSLIDLQSVGQDVYALNLLYPKGKSSKTTGEIDAVRGAQMLTSSFDQIFSFNSTPTSVASSDYLSKINGFLNTFGQVIGSAPEKIRQAKFYSKEAQNLNSSINSSQFPTSEQKSVANLQKFSTTSADFFDYLSGVPANLSDALTFSGGKKSYLILFLNNAELRPGGGFIGSFARMDLENGRAIALDFETNIYTLDKKFTDAGNIIAPPPEMAGMTPAWTMRDSNIFADYGASSEKVAWFYQQESALPAAKEIAGVISIDTTLFRNLLKAVGPINMPEYNLVVTDQNFLSDVQYQVEVAYFQNDKNKVENQPKKILADMMPKFVSAATKDSQVQARVGKEIFKAISEKHFLFYSTNPSVEDLVDGIGMSGKIHDTTGDYLYLSDANIGGLKSSLNIAETVDQNVTIDNVGTAKENLRISRKHNGSYEWPDGENINYLRLLLPLATQIDTSGLIPEVVSGKTSVAYWQNTKPGDTSVSSLDYHRGQAVDLTGNSFEYQITIQKQPGIESFNWNLYLVYPDGWKPQNVEGYDAKNHKIYLSQSISKDSVFRLRFIRD
ncbi:MAG: DUF4012 domain-containing protein [Candidatus Berkelbacteria bacterium]